MYQFNCVVVSKNSQNLIGNFVQNNYWTTFPMTLTYVVKVTIPNNPPNPPNQKILFGAYCSLKSY